MVTTTTIGAQGNISTTRFPAKYDGNPYAVSGLGDVTTMALQRVDERAVEITLTDAGRVLAKAERVVSPDWKTMAITHTQPQPAGQNVSVYERQ